LGDAADDFLELGRSFLLEELQLAESSPGFEIEADAASPLEATQAVSCRWVVGRAR